MFNPEKFDWRLFDKVENIPNIVVDWLLDNRSLTAKLREKYTDFNVKVVSQQVDQPYPCESALIDSYTEKIIIREVELIGNNMAVVFARSIIPVSSDTEELLAIGSKPLGEILFNDSRIIRGPLEVGKHNNSWARRSTFQIKNTKLLVSEIFLEQLYA
jgi:chorismate--pyruvate lyase